LCPVWTTAPDGRIREPTPSVGCSWSTTAECTTGAGTTAATPARLETAIRSGTSATPSRQRARPLSTGFERSGGGAVVDAGCGAGSHSRSLQRDGIEVLATDVSRGAVRVARERSVERVVRADLRSLPIIADCVLLAGTQPGIGGTVDAFRETLSALAASTRADGRIVGDLKDPFDVARTESLYRFDRGRGVGCRRFRTEYRGLAGPWLELLCLTPERARRVIEESAWSLTEVLEGDGARYFLVLER
jgi:SAM-dependent methyltransferase